MIDGLGPRGAPEPVPNDAAGLVLRVIGGWDPPEPTFSRLVALRWGDQDLREFSGAIDVRGDTLAIGWDPDSMAMFESAHLREFPATAELADGRCLSIDMLSFASNARLEGHYWSMSTPETKTNLWIGRVLGLDDRGGFLTAGNLSIRRTSLDEDGTSRTRLSNGHFRFSGAYTYYLFSRTLQKSGDTEWFMAIDTNTAGVPERGSVFADILTLQFVLGRAFYIDVLHGVQGTDVIGLTGGRHGRDHSHRRYSQSTVPLDFSDACWVAHFFELVSAAARTRPKLRLYIVHSFYLDGLASFHVEGRYLVSAAPDPS